MSKSYYSLGLMSGTSMDGVDASIIQSDGENKYKPILDKYFKYPAGIFKDLTKLRDKIKSSKDLKKFSKEVKNIEKAVTLFHVKVVNQTLKKTKINVDFIGFHGQTIYHNAKEKISKQLGNGKILSKLTKKNVVYNFRENDLKNGGQGAPLTPIFHKLLKKKFKIKYAAFVNIGGITNITTILDDDSISGADIGPGMCLIDGWIRKKSKENYDKYGKIAKSGKVNDKELNKLLENFYRKEKMMSKSILESLDTKDFNFSFQKNISLKDGAATLTEFSAQVAVTAIEWWCSFKASEFCLQEVFLCGGGRKNKYLIERIEKIKKSSMLGWFNIPIKLIDQYGVDGDFIESQAFAYLAIRSHLKLPISFPETTGVKRPCTGGIIKKNQLKQ
tara:strand:+ start:712 stop:1875 length:1164 start_codon:yes stop_codon:yes gene_type:complete